ncbi:MAG: type secretion system protein [Verrucomicrobiaceae bacterium]|nr:type secretion system protein [Verrucomicrobiaceae bacterium]
MIYQKLQHIERLNKWYQLRSERERKQLLIVFIVVVALVLPFTLIKSAWDFAQHARTGLDNEQALTSLIQSHADEIRALNTARQAKTGQDTSLLALASKTAIDHELTLERFEPGPDGKLAVWLTDTEFSKLLDWLNQITQQYDVQINRIALNQSPTPGKVEVQLILRQ